MLVYEIIVLTVVFLTSIGLGMHVGLANLFRAFQDWDALLLVLFGQYLIMPLLTWVAIHMVGGEPQTDMSIAIVLLGPGSEAAAAGVFLARANLPLAVISLVLTNIIGPVLGPELIDLIVQPEPAMSGPVLTAFSDILSIFFLALLAPLAIGMTVRQLARAPQANFETPFRVFIWLMLALTVIYAALMQAFEPPGVEAAYAFHELAGIVVVTILAYILVFGIGTLVGIRAENAIAAAFIVSLQPVAVSLYVSNNLTDAWPKLTELAIGYAMVLPFMIAACIFVIQRRLPFVRRR
ncbi:bile acid:sodium symporter [Marinibaculum pumilum]|uniref:Bile acid:sodium symporter n=1 Tax=Marinibaculum pumilum TaxID=1766165 RepID=A0ABV7L619_9PROT